MDVKIVVLWRCVLICLNFGSVGSNKCVVNRKVEPLKTWNRKQAWESRQEDWPMRLIKRIDQWTEIYNWKIHAALQEEPKSGLSRQTIWGDSRRSIKLEEKDAGCWGAKTLGPSQSTKSFAKRADGFRSRSDRFYRWNIRSEPTWRLFVVERARANVLLNICLIVFGKRQPLWAGCERLASSVRWRSTVRSKEFFYLHG